MKKENTNLSTKISFFWFGKKKDQEKPSLMLRRLLDFGKKALGHPLEFSRRLGQFQFPLRFFASPNTPTPQRHSIENLSISKSGLRLVSVKKLSFSSRP